MYGGDYRELHDTEMVNYRVYLREQLSDYVMRAHVEILDYISEGKKHPYTQELMGALGLGFRSKDKSELEKLLDQWNEMDQSVRDNPSVQIPHFMKAIDIMSSYPNLTINYKDSIEAKTRFEIYTVYSELKRRQTDKAL